MTAGILALLQGAVLDEAHSFSVSVYYATLTGFFPLALLALQC
jgi:hypothetical protein